MVQNPNCTPASNVCVPRGLPGGPRGWGLSRQGTGSTARPTLQQPSRARIGGAGPLRGTCSRNGFGVALALETPPPPPRTRVPLLIDLSQGRSDVQPEHVARPGAPGREEGKVQAWGRRWSPKWRGGAWADRTADTLLTEGMNLTSIFSYAGVTLKQQS